MREEDFPAIFNSADKLAALEQARFYSLLRLDLVLLTIAAAISLADVSHWLFAMLQAAILLLALALSIAAYVKRSEKIWYAARALAESVKTLCWRYVSRAEPFDSDDRAAAELLRIRLAATLSQNRALASKFSDGLDAPQVTDVMRHMRNEPLHVRMKTYAEARIRNQRQWYAAKARFNRIRSRRFFISLIVVNGFAVISALLRVRFPEFEFWPTDMLITISAAIVAFSQARRHSELAASYSLTAHEIGIIQEKLVDVDGEVDFSRFVGDAENAFSREHTQWEARKDV